VQPCSTAGPNADSQVGPQATAACVKLCGLDKWSTMEDWQYPLKTVKLAYAAMGSG